MSFRARTTSPNGVGSACRGPSESPPPRSSGAGRSGSARGRYPVAVRNPASPSAAPTPTGPLHWIEEGGDSPGPRQADPTPFGDVVLARKDIPASYHLAVTLDDALQGVTLVTRGEDLAASTHVHRVLQALLGLPTPRYRHHPLLTDAAGRRLSKRDGALTIRAMRQQGLSPGDIIALAETENLNRAGGGDRSQPRDIRGRWGVRHRAAGQSRGSPG